MDWRTKVRVRKVASALAKQITVGTMDAAAAGAVLTALNRLVEANESPAGDQRRVKVAESLTALLLALPVVWQELQAASELPPWVVANQARRMVERLFCVEVGPLVEYRPDSGAPAAQS